MVAQTCERMARGGMYDQLAGGFARYWSTGSGSSRTSRRCSTTTPSCSTSTRTGGQSATTRWHAGSPRRRPTSCWPSSARRRRLRLRPRRRHRRRGGHVLRLDARAAPRSCSSKTTPTGSSTSATSPAPSSTAPRSFSSARTPTIAERWQRIRAALRHARSHRTYPGRDDKVVAAWNGLAITALARAGVSPRQARVRRGRGDARPDWSGTSTSTRPARLHRTSRDGAGRYGPRSARGLRGVRPGVVSRCSVSPATSSGSRLAEALLDRILEQFVADGSYFDTAADAEALVWRPQDPTDNASPSGVSLAAEAFTTLASLTGSVRYETAARAGAADLGDHRRPARRGSPAGLSPSPRRSPPARWRSRSSAIPPSCRRTALTEAPWGTAIVAGEPGSRRTADGRPRSGRRAAGGVRLSEVHLPAAGRVAGRPST